MAKDRDSKTKSGNQSNKDERPSLVHLVERVTPLTPVDKRSTDKPPGQKKN